MANGLTLTDKLRAEAAVAAATTQILHIVPSDGAGGVEIAARAAAEAVPDRVRVHFLSSPVTPNPWSPKAIHRALRQAQHTRPSVVVFSLWKSVMAMVAFRFAQPRARRVLFLHSARPHHLADLLATSVMRMLADEVWADSAATLGARNRGVGRAISFVPHRLMAETAAARPCFVYWGRLAPEKCIGNALEIVALLASNREGIRFDIIGRDDGEEARLRQRTHELGISSLVRFHGQRTLEEIVTIARDASFYLQTSRYEGMALAVVEAMQLGLVPVVTPVGEISTYCTDAENAVVISSVPQAASAINALLDDAPRFARLSVAAAQHWKSEPLYHEDLLRAANDLLKAHERRSCAE